MHLLQEFQIEILYGELFDPHKVVMAPNILGVVKCPDSLPLNMVLYGVGGPLLTQCPCISSAFTRKSILHPAQLAADTPYLTKSIKEWHSGPGQEITSNSLPLKALQKLN